MIEYLRHRALDTSSDNYGSNIGAILMEYANVDHGRDHQMWSRWYREHGETFDLQANLRAREPYREGVKLRRDGDEKGAMAQFESALRENPGYLRARLEYASILNMEAWAMVTSPETSADLIEGLELARRCVELDPRAMYLDTLAEACYRNRHYEEALRHQHLALEMEPENREFRERLEKIAAKLESEIEID